MADQRIVFDEAAVEEIQKLKNGIVRQITERLARVVAGREPGKDGYIHINAEDVAQAAKELRADRTSLCDVESRDRPVSAASGTS